MFPAHIEGRVKLTKATEQASVIAERIASELSRVRASDVTRRGNAITFRGGVFRWVSNWNVLVPVSSGAIEVHVGSASEIEYRFSCVQMLVIATLMVAVVGFVIPENTPSAFRFGAPVLLWLWLFGMNYVIAAYRLRAFVRRAAGA